MQRLIVIILTVAILGGGLYGAGFASYRGYGLAASETQTSARSGSLGGIWILGGGPGGGK